MLRHLTLSFILIAGIALSSRAGSFLPASDTEPVIGRYLVSLGAQAPNEDDGAVIDALAKTYGARIEPFAQSGFRGFIAVMLPSRARLLAGDGHVLRVEELAAREAMPAPARLALPAQATARPSHPAPQWTEHDATTSWDSGSYRYDHSGNIALIGVDQYAYDGANRLVQGSTHAHGVATTETFQYDRYGNLGQIEASVARPGSIPVSSEQTLTVNAATNRVSQSCSGAQCAAWTFDAAGDQTTFGGAIYRWDAIGSMTELETGTMHERYVYDASEERIAVVSMSGTSEVNRRWTLRDLSNKVSRAAVQDVASDTWSGVQDYLYRNNTLLAAFDADEQAVPARHYHVDHLGTPRVITDSLSRKLAVDFYLPYGGAAPGQERDFAGFEERAQFTGHERDGANNPTRPTLDYMHARYYYSTAARFLSADPVTDFKRAAQSPQMWHRYAYVADNPLARVDPDGRRLIMVGRRMDDRKATYNILLSMLRKEDQKYVSMDARGVVTVDPKAKGGVALMTLQKLARNDVPTVTVELGTTLRGRVSDGSCSVMDINLQSKGGGGTAPPGLSLSGLWEVHVDPAGSMMTGGSATEVMAHELIGHAADNLFMGHSDERSAQNMATLVLMELGMTPALKTPNFPGQH